MWIPLYLLTVSLPVRAAAPSYCIDAIMMGTSPRGLPIPPAILRPSDPEASRSIITSRTISVPLI